MGGVGEVMKEKICTNCKHYMLCVPHTEGDGWGACCMFRKIVWWDDECEVWLKKKDVELTDETGKNEIGVEGLSTLFTELASEISEHDRVMRLIEGRVVDLEYTVMELTDKEH